MTEHEKLREAIKHLRSLYCETDRGGGTIKAVHDVCDAAESTLPKTKMVEVWRVEYVSTTGRPATNTVQSSASVNDGKIVANDEADRLLSLGCQCIRVTGPHMQEVPA